MTRGIRFRLACILVVCHAASSFARASDDLRLWYPKPAEKWTEALPIGSGRLGAMVFGGTATERIQYNEDTLWTGKPHDYVHPGAAETLPEIRRLVAEATPESVKAAEDLIRARFLSIP